MSQKQLIRGFNVNQISRLKFMFNIYITVKYLILFVCTNREIFSCAILHITYSSISDEDLQSIPSCSFRDAARRSTACANIAQRHHACARIFRRVLKLLHMCVRVLQKYSTRKTSVLGTLLPRCGSS